MTNILTVNLNWSADGHQTTIVCFKSCKLKEEVYKKRKTPKNKKLKSKLSLTRTRTKTYYAHEVTNENPEIINFVFAGPNENPKLKTEKLD